jgi:hypothetical protein
MCFQFPYFSLDLAESIIPYSEKYVNNFLKKTKKPSVFPTVFKQKVI